MRLLLPTVIALTLTVTTASQADDTPTAPTAAAPSAPSAPSAPTAAAPASPTVRATPTATPPGTGTAATVPTVARVTPVPVPVPALAPAPPPVAAAPPPAAAPPVATPAELPLALRPAAPDSKPLTLATEPTPTPWPYKLLFGAALIGACAIVWKKRRAIAARRAPVSTPVTILGKTSMGLRGELALVEVGGMRLLVGVTASSMQTLAVLPDDYAETAEEPATATAPAPTPATANPDLASRARSLFSALDVGPPVPARVAAKASTFAASRYAVERDNDNDSIPESAPAPKTRSREADRRRRPAPRESSRELPLEGQARGIALALGSRK